MPGDELKPTQRATLFVLMATARETGNPELYDRYGVTVDKSVRERLEQLGLLSSRRGPRNSFRLDLTDAGWVRGTQELHITDPVASRPSKMMVAAMGALANSLARYLERASMPASEFFQPPVDADGPPADLPARIRAAYWQLAKRPNQPVLLSALRQLLNGAVPGDVDSILVKMYADGAISLVPEANQKVLKAADRAAAVYAGGQDKHLLMIGAS